MPSRKSNARKSASGTLRPHRAPKPELAPRLAAAPPPPRHLSEGAKLEWRALAPAAWMLGTLTEVDRVAFALLAETLATAEAARQTVAAEGYTVATASGGQRPHPAVRIMEAARGQAKPLLDGFGLIPRARQALDLMPPGGASGRASGASGGARGRAAPGDDIAAKVRRLRASGGASDAA